MKGVDVDGLIEKTQKDLHSPQYTTTDIVNALRIPRERLREWLVRGYIEPENGFKGQGKKILFSREDVYKILLFMKLVDIGLSRNLAAEYLGMFSPMPYPSSYILLRHEKGIEPEIIISSISGDLGKWKIDLFSGISHPGFDVNKYLKGSSDNKPYDYTKMQLDNGKEIELFNEWDHLMIINLGKIYRTVDRALGIEE